MTQQQEPPVFGGTVEETLQSLPPYIAHYVLNVGRDAHRMQSQLHGLRAQLASTHFDHDTPVARLVRARRLVRLFAQAERGLQDSVKALEKFQAAYVAEMVAKPQQRTAKALDKATRKEAQQLERKVRNAALAASLQQAAQEAQDAGSVYQAPEPKVPAQGAADRPRSVSETLADLLKKQTA